VTHFSDEKKGRDWVEVKKRRACLLTKRVQAGKPHPIASSFSHLALIQRRNFETGDA